MLTKEEYFNKATFLKKGDIDPSNNYTVKADCYNVPISELDNPKDGKQEKTESNPV